MQILTASASAPAAFCDAGNTGAFHHHTFATNCYHEGMEVKILSKLLGHSDVNVTYNIYIHLYEDGFEEMYDALVSADKRKEPIFRSAQ